MPETLSKGTARPDTGPPRRTKYGWPYGIPTFVVVRRGEVLCEARSHKVANEAAAKIPGATVYRRVLLSEGDDE